MAVAGGGIDERGCSVRGSSSGNQSLEPPWLFYILGVGPECNWSAEQTAGGYLLFKVILPRVTSEPPKGAPGYYGGPIARMQCRCRNYLFTKVDLGRCGGHRARDLQSSWRGNNKIVRALAMFLKF